MNKIDIIDQIQKKPYWLIDVLPKQVPAGSAGQYFKAEQYFLSWLDEISWKAFRKETGRPCSAISSSRAALRLASMNRRRTE